MPLGPYIYCSLFPCSLQLATASISESLLEDICVWLAQETGLEVQGPGTEDHRCQIEGSGYKYPGWLVPQMGQP